MGINFKAKSIEFLEETNLKNESEKLLRHLNGNFYKRGHNVWEIKEYAEVMEEIAQLCFEKPTFLDDCREYTIKNITYALKAQCKFPDQEPNTFFGERKCSNIFYIPLRNIILKFTLLDTEEKVRMEQLEYSSSFFNTYILPYDYDPKAIAPKFNKFIDSIQTEDIKKVLLEWMGLNLTPVMLAQKFMIYYGLGANGKGIVTGIQRDLCGESNCSSLSLDEISGADKFKKAELENKTANITDEIEDVKATKASILKKIVGDGSICIERKYQRPYFVNLFCKFTFSSNVLVRFNDPSNGIFRRILIVPFDKQFLNEKDQNKELLKREYWEEELSGIFNLALEGLLRLIKNNWVFTHSDKIQNLLETYTTATSPETSFLKDYIEEGTNQSEIIKFELYQTYQRYCQLIGARSITEEQFGIHVRKVFPRVIGTNPLSRKNGRYRCWLGIKYIKNTPDLEVYSVQAAHTFLEIAPQPNTQELEDYCAED